jgi:outer membrane protein OmpA-like peptidoglycan-associated protein
MQNRNYPPSDNNKWLKPIALDPPINSEHEDIGIITDPLMQGGYFSSDRDKTFDIYKFETVFPQLFHVNYQKEDNFCFAFSDTGSIEYDPLLVEPVWDFGDGDKVVGIKANHCFNGSEDYFLHLDLVDKSTRYIFFSKLTYLLKVKKIEQPYINAPEIVVKGEELELDGLKSNLPGFTMVDFKWDLGEGSRSSGPEIEHVYKDTGKYDITLFLTLEDNKTGQAGKASVSRSIKVVNNQLEKQYYQAQREREERKFEDVRKSRNTVLQNHFSAEKAFNSESVFCLELVTSERKLSLNDPVFRNVPDKYKIKERIDTYSDVFSYTIECQLKLMNLYPAFREIRGLGFREAQAKLFNLNDPAEKELFNILKRYETSADLYFDRYNRLTTDAYIMLDQVVNFMIKYPQINIEVGVHTDNTGNASNNLRLTQTRANNISEYLQTRGIEEDRIIPRGYGEVKPIATNAYELDRRMNRRVEFAILP